MDKDLHTIDDIFNAAYQKYEEEPSAGLWEKLNAGLDKKDSELYKRKFIGWKRIAILLIFLFSGFVIYESVVIKKDLNNSSDHSNVKPSTLSAKKTNIQGKPNNSPADHTNNSVETNPVQERSVAKKYTKSNFLYDQNTSVAKKSIEKKIIRKSKLLYERQQSVLFQNKNKGFEITANKRTKIKKPVAEQPTGNNSFIVEAPMKNNATIHREISAVTGKENNDLTKIIMLQALPQQSSTLISPKPLTETTGNATNAKKIRLKFKPYWTATGFASADLAQYKLENETQTSGQQNNEKQIIGNREKHEASFSAGIMANWQLKKHWGLQTGFIYSNTSIAIDPQKMYAAQQANGTVSYKYITSSGYAYVKPDFGLPPVIGDSLNSSNAQHNLQSLSLPALVSYKIDKKKFTIVPAGGFTANFITSAKVSTEVEDALNKEAIVINGLNGMRNFYLGFLGTVNLQYHLSNRWSLCLIPSFKFAITPITKQNVVKTYPYSFGLGGGITYKF